MAAFAVVGFPFLYRGWLEYQLIGAGKSYLDGVRLGQDGLHWDSERAGTYCAAFLFRRVCTIWATNGHLISPRHCVLELSSI